MPGHAAARSRAADAAAPGRLPDDGDWVVEFAWEGLRCVAHVRPDRLTLRTANGRDVTSSFPELAEPLTRRAPREGMVLDGTIVAMGEGGLPRRGRLLRRTATARPSAALVRRTPAGLIVGDLLWPAATTRSHCPTGGGASCLRAGLARPPVVVAPSFPIAEAEAVMRTAEEYGAEALHARRLDAPYRPGRRSRAWLRVPLRRSGLVVVGGWNPADPRRPDSVGALLLGVPGDRGLRYVGRVGVAGDEQREIAALLARWRRGDPPFVTGPPPAVAAEAEWVAPELLGRVEFADWTADGRLRLPVWRGGSTVRPGRGERRGRAGPVGAAAGSPDLAGPRIPPQASEAAAGPPVPAQAAVGPAASAGDAVPRPLWRAFPPPSRPAAWSSTSSTTP